MFFRRVAVAVGLLLLVIAAAWAGGRRSSQAPARLGFSTFLRQIETAPAAFEPGTLTIRLSEPGVAELEGSWRAKGGAYVTTGFIDAAILAKLTASGVGFSMVREQRGWWSLALSGVPLVVVLLVLVFVLQGGVRGGGLAAFGRTHARSVPATRPTVTFADVAGVDEAREEIEEVVAFLSDPRKITGLGGRIPKGVLLVGAPGSGKTLLARAIAGEAGVPFFAISGSAFVEMFVGVGASRVRDLFAQAAADAPCIVFIDEIDAVARQRGAGLGGGHDEREQTLNQLLVEMDGFAPSAGVIVVAATNRPDVLDPALLRPGRFDRRIVVSLPDVRGRLQILQVHTRELPLAADVDLQTIARGTTGFSGADLASLCNEAALLAGRLDKPALDSHDLEMARDKVLMGPERRSLVISETDRRVMAFHEAGHALVGSRMKASDRIHKVTIVPRGGAMGMTQQLPLEDRLSVSRQAAEDQIALTMGGRAAEQAVFGQITTGAVNDLRAATRLARRMVCEWGMSEVLGPLHLGRGGENPFLARDLRAGRRHSERTAAAIDQEVRRIVLANEGRAQAIVGAEPDKLRAIAEALLERETLDGAAIDQLLAGGALAAARLGGPALNRGLPSVASA